MLYIGGLEPSLPVQGILTFMLLTKQFKGMSCLSLGARFDLLGRPSPQTPTPHLDRLLGTVSTWWARAAAQLPASITDHLPQSMLPPRAKASSTMQKVRRSIYTPSTESCTRYLGALNSNVCWSSKALLEHLLLWRLREVDISSMHAGDRGSAEGG